MGLFSKFTKKKKSLKENTAQNVLSAENRAIYENILSAEKKQELTLALRAVEPRLSNWLPLVLEGIDKKGDILNAHLLFLLTALEMQKNEQEEFLISFNDWLLDMGYEKMTDFRSELQYRLALALGVEDEEDEQDRLFSQLSKGLEKTKEQISFRIQGLVASKGSLDESFWEELEEIFIMADIGYETAMKLVKQLKYRAQKNNIDSSEQFTKLFQEELQEIFARERRITSFIAPEVCLMIGVNGAGKTTTIAKLAYRAKQEGKKVLIAAGDTFRAAAIEQLGTWAKSIDCGFFAKEAGADPAAVAFEAMDLACKEGYDLLLFDTAGRLQTQTNLMEELKKIKKVIGKKHAGAPHRTILIIDATTGQNGLSQTKLFNENIGIDEIILTKLDGTAKGGIVLSIALEYKIPISFVGLGEKMEDLHPFNGEDFAKALLS